MVFGLPLPVGVTSDAEYADFELSGDISPSEFSSRLNAELPNGIHITDAGLKTAKNNYHELCFIVIQKTKKKQNYHHSWYRRFDCRVDMCDIYFLLGKR
jgi:uncharacterized protein (DUF2344 family)